MSYIKKNALAKDDTIVLSVKRNALSLIASLFFHLLFILVVILVPFFGMKALEKNGLLHLPGVLVKAINIISYIFAAVILFHGLFEILKFSCVEYAVTTKKVVAKTGMFNSSLDELLFNKVENIQVKNPFWGKIFNYGDIVIKGANRDDIIFRTIKNANKVKIQISEIIEKSENKKEQKDEDGTV